MLQHNECIHPSLELQGEILQSTIPLNSPSKNSVMQNKQINIDKQIDLCKYWNFSSFRNDVDNELKKNNNTAINHARKIILHSYLLSVLYFICQSMYTCILFSDIVFKWTAPYVWVPRVCNDVLIIIVIMKWILLFLIQIH